MFLCSVAINSFASTHCPDSSQIEIPTGDLEMMVWYISLHTMKVALLGLNKIDKLIQNIIEDTMGLQ